MAETHLSQEMMERIHHWASKWIRPVIEWTSRLECSQCNTFIAPTPLPGAAAVDTLSTSLHEHSLAGCNPPWSLIPKILYCVSMFQCQVLMVVPFHQNDPWWLLCTKLMQRQITLIDVQFYLPDGTIMSTAKPLVCGIISGSISVTEEPLSKRRKLLSQRWEFQLCGGGSGVFCLPVFSF